MSEKDLVMKKPEEPNLHKILISSEFVNSPNYQKLLTFLVKATLDGNIPKELTIANEVYQIDIQDHTSAESNVRVYVHNLRKKLDTYYQKEGKADRIRLTIPKGKYKVEFIEYKEETTKKGKLLIWLTVILSVLVTAGNISISKFFLQKKQKNNFNKTSQYIWKEFFDSELPLLIIVGDYYLFKDIEYADRMRYIRDVRINSDRELNSFLKVNPDKAERYYATKHSLVGKYSVFCINDLVSMFANSGKKVRIMLASDFHWDEMKGNDIIFIGSSKSLYLLNDYIKDTNFKFRLYPNELQFHQIEGDSTYYYYAVDSDMDKAYESDYCIVAKLPGPASNAVLFFISRRDIGLIATVDYFTDPAGIKEFEMAHFDKTDGKVQYFESCFIIQGLQRNPVNIKMVNFNNINSTLPLNLPLSK